MLVITEFTYFHIVTLYDSYSFSGSTHLFSNSLIFILSPYKFSSIIMAITPGTNITKYSPTLSKQQDKRINLHVPKLVLI